MTDTTECTCCGFRHGGWQPARGEHCGWCTRRRNHKREALPVCMFHATGRDEHPCTCGKPKR